MRKKSKIVLMMIVSCIMLSGCTNYIKEGTEALKAEDFEQAQQLFTEAVEKDKNLKEAHAGLGICYWEAADYENALKELENAIEAGAEGNAPMYNMMGVSALKTEDFKKAVEYFQSGLEQEEMSEELRQEMSFNLIPAYEGTKDYEQAAQSLDQYLEKYPDDEKALKEKEFFDTQLK